jgi:predicted PurR-regulated permease PerM
MRTASHHLRRIDNTLRAAAVVALLLLSAAVLQDVLLLGFAASLVACVLAGAAAWLHDRTGIGAEWCLTAVIVLLASLCGAAVWLDGPPPRHR